MKTEKVSNVRAHTRYMLDGKRVPGVTTILGTLAKPALVPWANRLGLEGIDVTKYVDELAKIGTLGHYLIECDIKGEMPDLDVYSKEQLDRAENCLLKFYAWERENEVDFFQSELQLVSRQHRFGGTLDSIAAVNGKLSLVDFKTSKAIYPEMFFQLAAYRQLAKEAGYEIDNVRILRIGRTEEEGFEERLFDVKDLDPHWEIFYHALQIYNLKKRVS